MLTINAEIKKDGLRSDGTYNVKLRRIVSKDNPNSFILGDALGANISGVITSAIITGIYITIIPYL